MDAIRVARGYTGREKIIKFEGGYHGHHDDVLVSIQPPRDAMGPIESPDTVPASAGHPAPPDRRDGHRAVQRAGDARGHPRRAHARRDRGDHRRAGAVQHRRRAAAGRLPRAASASWPTSTAIVLIFDEVKTGVVLAWGGAYEYFGVQPDLFCLAKSIGGGIPIGAFGGKREVMARHRDARGHAGRPWSQRVGHRPLDDPRRRDARRAPRDVQRQPALDDGRARDPDADPHEGRVPAAARAGRSADGRLPGRASTSSSCPATRSTSGRRAA